MERGSRCITKHFYTFGKSVAKLHFLEKCRKTALFRKVPQNVVVNIVVKVFNKSIATMFCYTFLKSVF